MKIFPRVLLALVVTGILLGIGVAVYFYYVWSSNLPYIGSVQEYRPPIITEIYSSDGEVIGRFWDEKRIVVPLDTLPGHLVNAFIAAEDSRFFEHEGVDLRSIFRAFLKNLKAGRIEQGGSTITQQVTKSLLLKNTERTYRRKVREAILSIQLDRAFTKEQILFLYLNQIYLGQGAYGVEAAARTYFNKTASDLSVSESAMLAGLPQAPARYSPVKHLGRARARQEYVLERMLDEGFIDKAGYEAALSAQLDIQQSEKSTFLEAPYFTEHVRKYLLDRYGRDLLYREGLKVYTTLDLSMQRFAREALDRGLKELDKREGYRGPIRKLSRSEMDSYAFSKEPAGVDSVTEAIVISVDDKEKELRLKTSYGTAKITYKHMKWARKPDPETPHYNASLRKPSNSFEKGDLILIRLLEESDTDGLDWEASLEQAPEIQGALLCMEKDSFAVKAMVGGRGFSDSQFNRAIQSRRQPGSAFKPFIYSAALDWGMTPATVLMDAPFISEQADDEKWKPKNYKGKFYGPTLFRTGLIKSRNVITVKILKKIGIEYAIKYARLFGIESDLSPNLSLALGSSGLSLLEMTRAYAVFANGGMLGRPIFIEKIMDRSGNIIEENHPEFVHAISRETAAVVTELLKSVIKEGTGWRIRALKRPAAGKTGTTNNLLDAWFMGYTPEFATGVWVGYDKHRPMGKGETGSRAASPIWLYFMSRVLEGMPVSDFEVPSGVVFAKIDAETGLLAAPHTKKAIFQAFRKGKAPSKYSPRPSAPKSDQFFQFDMGSD